MGQIIISAIGRSLATIQGAEAARRPGRSYMLVRMVHFMLGRDEVGKLLSVLALAAKSRLCSGRAPHTSDAHAAL